MPLVKDVNDIRLAMLGMVDGNGHPYSWSAIINGRFDAETMSRCPYPVIPQYLSAQLAGALGIPGAKVTHIWCDDPADATAVAKSTYIPNIVERPEDVLGHVDAVIIPTDIGGEHLDRARPFIEAGLPVFIDKPLTDREDHLAQFLRWHRQGKPFMSTSCMRYGVEFEAVRRSLAEMGELRLLTMTMCKSWERYGIHALEGVYPFLAPGRWKSVSHRGDASANIMHLRHMDGVDVVLNVIADLYGAFGCLGAFGTKGHRVTQFSDTFAAFKTQLVTMVNWLRTGEPSVPFAETIELMRIIIAALRSRNEGGRVVEISEIGAGL
jgi:uncharacterized protein YjeT (DUF2065 family)